MGSRYPDALGGADPAKLLQHDDAVLAIECGQSVFAFSEGSVVRLCASALRGE